MKLSFRILTEELQRRCGDDIIRVKHGGSTVINHVSRGKNGINDENTLYIVDEQAENGRMYVGGSAALICLTDGADSAEGIIAAADSFCFMRRGRFKTAVDLMAEVMDIMSYYSGWCDRMLEVIRQGGGFYKLVDTAHEVFRNPMIIYDSSMKILAYTRSDGSDDEMWTDTVAAGTARIENEIDSEELRLYVSLIENSRAPFKHMGRGMTDPFYTAVVSSKGKRLGVVTEMERRHVISPGELELLQIFCEYVSIMMQQEDENVRSARGRDSSLVEDLIAGRIVSSERLATRVTALGWSVLKYYTVVQFVPTVSYVSQDHRKRLFIKLSGMGLSGRGCIAYNDRHSIYFILTHSSREIISAVKDTLRDFCLSNNLRCAYSDPYEQLTETAAYAAETDAVLELTEDIDGRYADIRLEHMLSEIRKNESCGNMILPAVKLLMQSDSESGTEYIKTLKTFIQCRFHQLDTAARLSIHRTTLMYRLGKLSELSGLKLDNADELLHAAVSIKLLEL